MRFRDAGAAGLAAKARDDYALTRAMTNQHSSILERTSLAPPPAIELGRAHWARALAQTDEPSPAPQNAAPHVIPSVITSAAPSASLRKRLAALLALMAVPAMAAPGDFGAMAGDAANEPVAKDVGAGVETAMAFEKPGMSFPGSAFYYLADPPKTALIALPESDPFERGALGGREVGSRIDAGPAASAFFAGSGSNFARAQSCLAQAIWYEAASESEAGQRAVAQVVLNRVAHPSWPASVCGVVYEGSNRSTGCQFSFTCDGSLVRRAPGTLKGANWARAQAIAGEALSGSVYAPIGHATHYHTLWVNPYWASSLDPVGTIGAHRFYRSRGNAGEKSAFSARYDGAEPTVAGGNLSSAAMIQADLAALSTGNPIAANKAKTMSEPSAAPPETVAKGTEEVLADGAVAKSGKARNKYARAGQWKVDPATLNPNTAEKKADDASDAAKPPMAPQGPKTSEGQP